MKRLVLAVPLLWVAAGCGSGMSVAGTKLTLTAVNANVGRAVFHLDCAPARGDVPDPAAACAALGRDPKLVTAPKPYTCLGGPTSWFDMTISGRLAGKPVHGTFSTCWTPQMATLRKLGLASSLGGTSYGAGAVSCSPAYPAPSCPARSVPATFSSAGSGTIACKWASPPPSARSAAQALVGETS